MSMFAPLKFEFNYKLIRRYVAMEFTLSFLIAFSFLFFAFFVNQLLLIGQELGSKNVPTITIVRLLIYATPNILNFTFPYAALVGTFMAVGRLSSENEVLGMLVCGVPRIQIVVPLLLMGVLVAVLSYGVNNYLLPVGNLKYRELLQELLIAQPEIELTPYSVKQNDNQTIVTSEVTSEGVFIDLLIFDKDEKDNQRTILAKKSQVQKLDSKNGGISIVMRDVFILSPSQEEIGSYNYQTAKRLEYNIPLDQLTKELLQPGPRDLPSREVRSYLNQLEEEKKSLDKENFRDLDRLYSNLGSLYSQTTLPQGADLTLEMGTLLSEQEALSFIEPATREYRNWKLEFLQKFTLPIVSIPFVLLAFPLGLMARRSGRSVGFLLGIIFCVLHWSLLAVSRIFGFKFLYFPISAIMWSPVAFFFLLAATWYVKPAIEHIKLKRAGRI